MALHETMAAVGSCQPAACTAVLGACKRELQLLQSTR